MILTKTSFSAFPIYPKVTLTYKISIHTHAAFFSENLKFSSDKNHGVFRRQDKQEEEDRSTASLNARPSLTGIWFVYYYVVFQAALCFLSSRAVPTAVFDIILSTSTTNSRTVLCQFHAKDRLKYNQTVTEKFEQRCKVTDNTVMVVIFTVDAKNEIIQMKYNVPSQKRPCLHTNEIGSRSISRLQYRHTVYFMDWSF